jgi:hypothetical protein
MSEEPLYPIPKHDTRNIDCLPLAPESQTPSLETPNPKLETPNPKLETTDSKLEARKQGFGAHVLNILNSLCCFTPFP